MELVIYINADGTIEHVYDDALADLFIEDGIPRTRRASHVEPFGFGWMVDMRPVGGPVLFDTETDNPLGRVAFKTRAAALAAERAWIDAHLTEGSLR